MPFPVWGLPAASDYRQFLVVRHFDRAGGLRTEPNQGTTAGGPRHAHSALGKAGEHVGEGIGEHSASDGNCSRNNDKHH